MVLLAVGDLMPPLAWRLLALALKRSAPCSRLLLVFHPGTFPAPVSSVNLTAPLWTRLSVCSLTVFSITLVWTSQFVVAPGVFGGLLFGVMSDVYYQCVSGVCSLLVSCCCLLLGKRVKLEPTPRGRPSSWRAPTIGFTLSWTTQFVRRFPGPRRAGGDRVLVGGHRTRFQVGPGCCWARVLRALLEVEPCGPSS